MNFSAIYPGSFDPITNGHIDIIRRFSCMSDDLIILVAKSSTKKYTFSTEERCEMLKESVGNFKSIRIDSYDGLTVNYAKQNNINMIFRGIRSISDYEYEMTLANMNKKLMPGLETLFIFSEPDTQCISSGLVKEIAKYGGDLSKMVPDNIAKAFKKKYKI